MTVVVLFSSHLLERAGAGHALRLAVEAAVGALAYAAALYWIEPAWCRETAAAVGFDRTRVRPVEGDVA